MSPARRQPIDPQAYYLLLAATLALGTFGLVMVFSAGTGLGLLAPKIGDPFYFVRRQALWFAIGLVFLGVFSALDYRRLGKLPEYAWYASVALLVAVWIPGLGWTSNGATRWIGIGDFTIQPSEIAKLVVLVCVAQALARLDGDHPTMRQIGEVVARWALVPFALVILQRDMGTAMTMLVGPIVVCFVLGMRWRDLLALVGGVGALGALLIVVEPYRAQRFAAFLDPWKEPQRSGYQAIQALYAFGSGGWHGIGLGAGRQKFLYLPAAHTDFIFAVIGEELGLIGALCVVVAFGLLAYAGFRIALKAKDPFGRALAGGIIGAITFQAILNMAAVTNLAPITGVPLPLVSFGGWALLMAMAGIGLVLAIGSPQTGGEG